MRFRVSTSGSGSNFRGMIYRELDAYGLDTVFIESMDGFGTRGLAMTWARRRIAELQGRPVGRPVAKAKVAAQRCADCRFAVFQLTPTGRPKKTVHGCCMAMVQMGPIPDSMALLKSDLEFRAGRGRVAIWPHQGVSCAAFERVGAGTEVGG